jgi:hypothetical protein
MSLAAMALCFDCRTNLWARQTQLMFPDELVFHTIAFEVALPPAPPNPPAPPAPPSRAGDRRLTGTLPFCPTTLKNAQRVLDHVLVNVPGDEDDACAVIIAGPCVQLQGRMEDVLHAVND